VFLRYCQRPSFTSVQNHKIWNTLSLFRYVAYAILKPCDHVSIRRYSLQVSHSIVFGPSDKADLYNFVYIFLLGGTTEDCSNLYFENSGFKSGAEHRVPCVNSRRILRIRGSIVIKALCHKQESHEFKAR
jgi:hypothetical protein